MTRSKEVFVRAKQLQGRPVCITLHSGETYVGYLTDACSSGLTLANAGALSHSISGKQRSHTSGNRRSGSRRSVSHKRSAPYRVHNASVRSRSRKPHVRVSAFLPILGSLFGGLGGGGGLGGASAEAAGAAGAAGAASAGGFGGMLSGGMQLFGMFQRFYPVFKMGYGMVKSIRPFLGAVQGLMSPA